MKTKIELILGFLESGKTTFINSMLHSDQVQNETIVIIQNEFGESEIADNNRIIVMENDSAEDIHSSYINSIITKFNPDRIFIEINGMADSSAIVNALDTADDKNLYNIDDIITLIDCHSFNLYLRNMHNFLFSHISNSNKIILNNTDSLDKKDLKNILTEIKKINETSSVIKHVSLSDSRDSSENEYLELTDSLFSLKTMTYIFLIIFSFTFISAISLLDTSVYSEYVSRFQKFYTVFISILIESFPFILLGSFISALIQVFISKDKILKLFPENIFLSCTIAAFAGILFPICDCGIIPIVKGLIKKKVPISPCITFMLAAPIVNPVTIISTLYAFQNMKSVVICRLACGIVISIIIGIALHFFTNDTENILIDENNIINCECAVCSPEYDSASQKSHKLSNLFLHTGNEFFNIGRFMIFGAFICSLLQCTVSLNSGITLPKDNVSLLLIMMLCAFFLSICSTSDAFIARGFLQLFSMNSIMGFLVVGPMLDIKNTLMMFGNFKKIFVLKLIFLIVLVSFSVLVNINMT